MPAYVQKEGRYVLSSGGGERDRRCGGESTHRRGDRSIRQHCRVSRPGPGVGRHREMGGRETSGSSSSMGCAEPNVSPVPTTTTTGAATSAVNHVDSHITTHIMGDCDVTGTGVSLVIYIHVRGLGGNFALRFVFIDIREVLSYHHLRVSLVMSTATSSPISWATETCPPCPLIVLYNE